MPYPNQYIPKFDLKKAQNAGDTLSATELFAEISNISSSLNQAIQFIRSITTANMKIQPSQVSGSTFVIDDEQTASAAQTDIYFANSVTIDPTVSTVGVFINGARLPDSSVTLFTDHVVVTPALNNNDNIVMEIHDNAASVFNDLISTLNGLGASLVGIEDVNGLYSSADVEDALQEVAQGLVDFIVAVGDLSKYLKADAAVPFEVDQDANGKTIKNLAPAVDPNDPVILSQVTTLLSVLSNLAGTFLPLVGGVMQGPINMASKRITSVADPVSDGDAINKAWLDAAIDTINAAKLSLEGNKDSTANATLTGATFYSSTDDADVADADQTTDPAGVAQPTLNNVPRPATNRQIANKVYVDATVASAVSTVQLNKGSLLKRSTGTQVIGLVTISQIGTGHHQIIVPAGVTQLFIGGLGGGGGAYNGGGGGNGGDGAAGSKTYFTINAGSDQNLGMGGSPSTQSGNTAGAGGAVGAAATFGAVGESGETAGAAYEGLGGAHPLFGGTPGRAFDNTAIKPLDPKGFGIGGTGGFHGTGVNASGGGSGGYGEVIIDVVETDVIDIYEGAGGAGYDGPSNSDGGDGSGGFAIVRWGE